MIDFTLFDSLTFQEELIEKFEEASGEVLSDGDERNTILNVMLYLTECIMNEINAQANNNLIAFCDLPHLIYYGAQQDTYRLEATYAKCRTRFTISGQADGSVTIPKGTRVTADGKMFFETTEETVVAPASYADIDCIATDTGASGNGYGIGQINILVNTIPYVESVSNITASSGGADIQSEEDFRESVFYAPLKYNTTGSEGAYVQRTKEVSANIKDVAVIASGANISVYILCKGGALPSNELLAVAQEYLSQKDKKAITDNVTCLAAVRKNYTVSLKYKINRADHTTLTAIQEEVENAVNEYVTASGEKMGTNINPEMFLKTAYSAGAASVTVLQPSQFIDLEEYEVPYCTSITITYDGMIGE